MAAHVGLLALPADHVNLTLHAGAAAAQGHRVVLVDDGGADARKYVAGSAAALAALACRHGPRVRGLKLKGAVSAADVAALATDVLPRLPALATVCTKASCLVGGAAGAPGGGSTVAAALAAALAAAAPRGCEVVAGKKAAPIVLGGDGVEARLAAALATRVAAPASSSSPSPTAHAAPSLPFKVKAKLARSMHVLQAPDVAAAVVAGGDAGADGAAVGSGAQPLSLGGVTTLKVRGPLTPATLDALCALLRGGDSVRTVKCVRYWLAGGTSAVAAAAALVSASAAAASAGGAPPPTLFVKRKGVGSASVALAVGADGEAAVAAALAAHSAPPPGKCEGGGASPGAPA